MKPLKTHSRFGIKLGFFPILTILLLTACDGQRGRFFSLADHYQALLPAGYVEVVSGCDSKSYSEGTAHEENLLYVVVLSSGISGVQSSTCDLGENVTKLSHSWKSDRNVVTVVALWDRQSDTVSVGSHIFLRKDGSLFVVQFKANGEISVLQLADIGTHAGPQQVLQSIQQKFPHDGQIQSLQLNK